jgi:hypothetical protein
MGMPARHISTQSFDHLLSELGDDPAIPDPHGIRKTTHQKNMESQTHGHSNSKPILETAARLDYFKHAKTSTAFIALAVLTGALLFGGLIAYGSINHPTSEDLQESQNQISALQKELTLLRKELDEEVGALYDEIEILEVSIHSLNEIKPKAQTISRPAPHPGEQEIRRWRYLGSSQMGGIQQALFHHGKSHVLFPKDALVLGEWRLTQIEKDAATLSHPQGKSITLKPVKSE